MNRVLLASLFLIPVMGYPIAVTPAKAEKAVELPVTVESQLIDVEKRIFYPPVDALIDRVWHAIPGLNGIVLDFKASLQKTEQAHDGKLHPVVKETPAKVLLVGATPYGPNTPKQCMGIKRRR